MDCDVGDQVLVGVQGKEGGRPHGFSEEIEQTLRLGGDIGDLWVGDEDRSHGAVEPQQLAFTQFDEDRLAIGGHSAALQGRGGRPSHSSNHHNQGE